MIQVCNGLMVFFMTIVLWPADTSLPAYLSTLNMATVLMLYLSTYHHNKTSFLCCLGKPKLELNEPTDRHFCHGWIKQLISHWSYLFRKPKFPFSHMLNFYCQRDLHLYMSWSKIIFCLAQLGQGFCSITPSGHPKKVKHLPKLTQPQLLTFIRYDRAKHTCKFMHGTKAQCGLDIVWCFGKNANLLSCRDENVDTTLISLW